MKVSLYALLLLLLLLLLFFVVVVLGMGKLCGSIMRNFWMTP